MSRIPCSAAQIQSTQTRRCSMRLISTLFLIAVLFSLTLNPYVKPASASNNGDEQIYYAMAVEAIITNCEKKKCLKDSRSIHLRRCAGTAASKVEFLRRYKERLIEGMMTENLSLKRYKVERYVNARFFDHIQLKP